MFHQSSTYSFTSYVLLSQSSFRYFCLLAVLSQFLPSFLKRPCLCPSFPCPSWPSSSQKGPCRSWDGLWPGCCWSMMTFHNCFLIAAQIATIRIFWIATNLVSTKRLRRTLTCPTSPMTKWSSCFILYLLGGDELELHLVIVDIGNGQVKVPLNLWVETRLFATQKIQNSCKLSVVIVKHNLPLEFWTFTLAFLPKNLVKIKTWSH